MSLRAKTRVLTFGLVVGLMVILGSRAASAQDRQAVLSGGWSYVHDSDESMPAGWYVSGARYLNSWFGVAGEVNGHYKTITTSGVERDHNFHVFTVGPRFAYRRNPRFTPFVDLLAGARSTGAETNAGTSRTDFAYQSIVGLEINNSNGSLGVRIAVGDHGIHADDEWTNGSLFEAGVVIRP